MVEVDQGDTPEAAAGRVDLKLAAAAYHEAGHRQDSGARLLDAALVRLVQSSLVFYVRLSRLDGERLQQMAQVVTDARSGDPVDHAVARVQIQALAYASSRHGADACTELSRAALGVLCQAAVDLAQVTLDVLGGGVDPTDASTPRTRGPVLALPTCVR